jgi:hypothetical protein
MIQFSESSIVKLIGHSVGNKQQNGHLVLSKNELEPDSEMQEILKAYFFSSFKESAFYIFSAVDEKMENNVVYKAVKELFDDNSKFKEIAEKLATYLYDMSMHPLIKEGEMYLTLFKNCVVDDEIVDAIGIFKSENKDTFLKVRVVNDNLEISQDNGINIKKLDKGCLVFNTEKESGYKVCMVDISGKSKEANYWKDSFLQLEQRKDDFYQTQNHIEICKGFVKNVFNYNNGVEKADQIDLLNKTSEYFQKNEEFDLNDFNQKVIGDQDVFDAFKQYRERVSEESGIETSDKFDISESALKKGKHLFKSVLKLDKNFHVYIHGDRSRISKGFDNQTGLNYYQIFYETEN